MGVTNKLNAKSSKKYESHNLSMEDDSDARRKEFEVMLNKFLTSRDDSLSLSKTLNSWERRVVHEIADNLGVLHESVGEGSDRHIVLRKKGIPNSDEAVKSEDDKENTPEKDANVVSVKTKSGSRVECCSCQKSVPKQNIELHKARCEKNKKLEQVQQNDFKEPLSSEKKESKKKKGKKKKDELEDDFKTLCDSFQKLDSVCNFPKCKVKVSTLGVTCPFCRLRFCLSHSMAEVHGCGEAARQAARQNMLREGKFVPGSGPVNHLPDAQRRAQLERSLNKKLTKMEEKRQTKKKEK